MRTEDAPEVRSLSLFRALDDGPFEALIRGAYLQTFPPQVQLIDDGDTPDFLHILIEGSVEMFARWNGRETTMDTLGPVSTFILAATITDRPYLMAARTLEKSRIALIPSEDVRQVFAEDRNFASAIVVELAGCYRDAVRTTKNLKLRNSVERLAVFLLRQEAAAGGTGVFDLPYEKRIIASWLGMTPENLSRAFGTLKAYGVAVDGARVRITNPDELRALAKPTRLIDRSKP